MQSFTYALGSVIGVSLLSLLGMLFFLIGKQTVERTLLYVVSFSTGALFGDVFLHILPDLAAVPATFQRSMLLLLCGVLFSFAVEKIIRWRHCHVLPELDECAHDEGDLHHHHHTLGLMSVLAEAVHNLIDGIVIAASYLTSIPLGIATTIAIIFHEIPHEIGNMAVLLHSGYGKRRALLLNLVSASAAIIGTVGVFVASGMVGSSQAYLLPFAAGNLLYIAGSDLIPELHRQTRLPVSILQLLALIAGIGFMWGMLVLE